MNEYLSAQHLHNDNVFTIRLFIQATALSRLQACLGLALTNFPMCSESHPESEMEAI